MNSFSIGPVKVNSFSVDSESQEYTERNTESTLRDLFLDYTAYILDDFLHIINVSTNFLRVHNMSST